jgi:hypothetical protein
VSSKANKALLIVLLAFPADLLLAAQSNVEVVMYDTFCEVIVKKRSVNHLPIEVLMIWLRTHFASSAPCR